MTAQQNEQAVRRVYEEGWNKGNLDVLDECLAPDYVDHEAPPGMNKGIAAAKQLFQMFRSIVADNHWHIEDAVASGDKVVVRVAVRGVHRGNFLGAAPTNQEITFRGIDMFRVVDGKLTDHWGAMNMNDLARILGAGPKG